jgi:hypothetical protein
LRYSADDATHNPDSLGLIDARLTLRPARAGA